MEERNIYSDIAQRTNGDIYIGVVGPVRTGKSTFIKRFMDTLVIPNISDEYVKQRALGYEPRSIPPDTLFLCFEKLGELADKASSPELDKEIGDVLKAITATFLLPGKG